MQGHVHGNILPITFNSIARADPTKTVTLRNQFLAEVNRRFKGLKKIITKAVVDLDVFGLNPIETLEISPEEAVATITARQYAFMRSGAKVDAFMAWLKEMESRQILEVTRGFGGYQGIEVAWTDTYIRSAYQKGMLRARQEMRAKGMDIPAFDAMGVESIAAAFNLPFHLDRVGLLFSRTFNELKGVTDAMDQQISRILAQGMAEGRHPLEIARTLNDRVDKIGITRARVIARTEITRAHHLASINEYRNAGIIGVEVFAEWMTAGSGVCELCAPLEGQIFTIDEIENMIPAHPNCLTDCNSKVFTYDGWKTIKDVKAGDLVLTHKERYRRVTQLHRTPVLGSDTIRFNVCGTNEMGLPVTPDHPVLVNGGWALAKDMKVGDDVKYLVRSFGGNHEFANMPVTHVEQSGVDDPMILYNLSVDEDESYVANGFAVHNCRCVAIPVLPEHVPRGTRIFGE